jgi:rubrerythrin
MYLQFARACGDERVRRVFEDIAKEEKTHVGEFLALLKSLDAEQASQLEAGERGKGAGAEELTRLTAL